MKCYHADRYPLQKGRVIPGPHSTSAILSPKEGTLQEEQIKEEEFGAGARFHEGKYRAIGPDRVTQTFDGVSRFSCSRRTQTKNTWFGKVT